jgi:hypothetical protein
MGISSIIHTITIADEFAQRHPNVAQQIYELVRTFCQRGLPTTDGALKQIPLAGMEVSFQVAKLCR